MTTTMEEQNAALRAAVAARLANTPKDDHRMQGYVTEPLPERKGDEVLQQKGCASVDEFLTRVNELSHRQDSPQENYSEWTPPAYAAPVVVGQDVLNEWAEFTREEPRQTGDGVLGPAVHPTSQAFFDLCDALKDMHRRKSSDYGCPSGTDPLANIRNGARFVGIPSWKGAMVRLSDKVTRLATYNATGKLENESLEDNLFDLASYSLLALLLHREDQT
jgi:hypothetical protein